jgi:hypothetical protein
MATRPAIKAEIPAPIPASIVRARAGLAAISANIVSPAGIDEYNEFVNEVPMTNIKGITIAAPTDHLPAVVAGIILQVFFAIKSSAGSGCRLRTANWRYSPERYPGGSSRNLPAAAVRKKRLAPTLPFAPLHEQKNNTWSYYTPEVGLLIVTKVAFRQESTVDPGNIQGWEDNDDERPPQNMDVGRIWNGHGGWKNRGI